MQVDRLFLYVYIIEHQSDYIIKLQMFDTSETLIKRDMRTIV